VTAHLTTQEFAERTRETSETIARRCAAGIIPATKIGRRWLIAAAVAEQLLKPTNVDPSEKVRSTAGRRSA
jgi:excisionase family DNA binding protein